MCPTLSRLVIVLVVVSTFSCATAVHVYKSVELFEYRDFSSTWPFVYHVPESTAKITWDFQAGNKEADTCSDKNITIYIQQGSLPVANPDGEKFPDNFFLKRRASQQTWIMSNNKSIATTVNSPLAGPWYIVVSLPKSDTHIRPADLFVACKYDFRSRFSVTEAQPVHVLSMTDSNRVSLTGHGSKLYRFLVDIPTSKYTIHVSKCSRVDKDHMSSTNSSNTTIADPDHTSCPVSMVTEGSVTPTSPGDEQDGRYVVNCTSVTSDDCHLAVLSPQVHVWNYLTVISHVNISLEFQVTIETEECSAQELPVKGMVKFGSQSRCHLLPLLDRYSHDTMYKTEFMYAVNNSLQRAYVNMAENQSVVVPFLIQPLQDTGGSLAAEVNLQRVIVLGENENKVRVSVCLQSGSVPQVTDLAQCPSGSSQLVSDLPAVAEGTSKVIIPYPQPGVWFVAMVMSCVNGQTANQSTPDVIPCGNLTASVSVSVAIDQCVEGGCSDHGSCHNYLNGHILFSTCKCNTGWKGFACTDGMDSKQDYEQLLELLLLTLSNILFLPAIILALYRRHYVEALVYAYNMVFSALYHMCDGNRTPDYKWCLLPIPVLSTVDFVASATSIWITLVAMVRPPLPAKAVLQVAGPLAFIVGVMYRKTSAWIFIAPAAVGLLLICIAWVCRCCVRHKCYPSKKRYLLCLLPGILLAIGGLGIFTFAEKEENYMFTHSAWHAAMALCIVFLLPPRYKKKDKYNVSSLGPTYQPIATGGRGDENRVI